METGSVRFFDSRPEKRFGFVLLETEEEIFFHFNDGQFVIPGEKEPKFSGSATQVIQGKACRLRDPRKDDKVVFVRAPGSKGDKASPWGYETHYERALEIIAKRSKPLRYRVVRVFDSPPGTPGEPQVEWGGERGRTLEELCARYPRDRWDDLKPFSDSDNIFDTRAEIQVNDGLGWEPAERDPRPIINASRPVRRQL